MLAAACLLMLPLVVSSHNQTGRHANHTTPSAAHSAALDSDTELQLPPPSLLYQLYETITDVFSSMWTNNDTDSRQVNFANGNLVITLGTFIAALLATVFGVVGFGSVGLLAAKALSVGTLALFLTAMNSLKHKSAKSESSGPTVHFVPIQSGHNYHDYFHDRNEPLSSSPFIAYTDRKL